MPSLHMLPSLPVQDSVLPYFAKPFLILNSQAHKNCGPMTEIEAKVRYVKLARSLKTYGVSFFLVKVGAMLFPACFLLLLLSLSLITSC